jgi:hypothetical protein
MARKLIARISGGIGNQLFTYAAARRLALVNDAELALDDTSGFEPDVEYQRRYQLDRFRIPCRKATTSERLGPFSRVRRHLKIALNRRRPFESRSYVQQEGFAFDPRLLRLEPRGTVYFEGYWQSEAYFKDVEATIRSDLRIEPPTDAANIETAERIRGCTAVAVHVRFFDEPGKGGINNAPSEYYSRALSRMEELAPQAHYFLFSDRPDAARSLVALPAERVTCISHNHGDDNAYADLWLMTHATHFVIANSTFSWWGAWLGERGGTIVIAPGFVMREGKMWWGFEGLLPERWIKV